jgi:hypothetical protein
MLYRGKSSLFYIFSSFVGALLVAGAFFYNNYRFAKFKFINFNDTILYSKKDIFTPKQDYYYMLVFSSKMDDVNKLIAQIPKDYPIIIIDIYQKSFDNRKRVIFTRAGTNTILSIIQKFNIYKVPIYFGIKRYNKQLFKQDTNLEVINTIKD